MGMDEIWALLTPEARDWLVANNGDAVPADLAVEIDDAVDASGADDVWANDGIDSLPAARAQTDAQDADEDEEDDEEDTADREARYLSDEAVDWIEERANDVE